MRKTLDMMSVRRNKLLCLALIVSRDFLTTKVARTDERPGQIHEKSRWKGANILEKKTMTYYQHQKYLKVLPRKMDVIYAFWRRQKPLNLTELSRAGEGLNVKSELRINILETYSVFSSMKNNLREILIKL